MAGKENISPEGKLLFNLTKAEMIVGIGISLIPGLGAIGALTFMTGAGEYLILKRVQRKSEKNMGG